MAKLTVTQETSYSYYSIKEATRKEATQMDCESAKTQEVTATAVQT